MRSGGWMHENGASIYGCGNADLPKPEWGRYTRRGDRLYAHILDRGIGPINLRGLRKDQLRPPAGRRFGDPARPSVE